jgi:hypothetical protein
MGQKQSRTRPAGPYDPLADRTMDQKQSQTRPAGPYDKLADQPMDDYSTEMLKNLSVLFYDDESLMDLVVPLSKMQTVLAVTMRLMYSASNDRQFQLRNAPTSANDIQKTLQKWYTSRKG